MNRQKRNSKSKSTGPNEEITEVQMDRLKIDNAKIGKILIGSKRFDDRFFMLICTSGYCSQDAIINIKGISEPMYTWIDRLIEVCGASDLFDCQDSYVRVIRTDATGLGRPIVGLVHILDPSLWVPTGMYKDPENFLLGASTSYSLDNVQDLFASEDNVIRKGAHR